MNPLEQLRESIYSDPKFFKWSSGLTSFPQELFKLSATLEYLDLSGNELSSLPDDFDRFTNLKIFFLSQNNFTIFPRVLGKCKKLDIVGFKKNKIKTIPEDSVPVQLRWLILTDNEIESLPDSIGNCINIRKFMLAGNNLKALPEGLKNLRNLELLRLSSNNFDKLPEWLFDLPKLSWLAVAGNPCMTTSAAQTQVEQINWKDLTLGNLLGSGASGMIYQAELKKDKANHPVAVKIFKGEVTSDGLPDDEMEATLASGRHQNLIPLIGKIFGNPDNKKGLVLELIDPSFRNLGLPPDFKTCTRDTFADGTKFSDRLILKIMSSMTDTLIHLHDRQIMHGDFYAHNILIQETGEVLLSDFGAGTRYSTLPPSYYQKIELLEVRALGCLLDDLLSNDNLVEGQTSLIATLEKLRIRMMEEVPQKRPTLKEIAEELAEL